MTRVFFRTPELVTLLGLNSSQNIVPTSGAGHAEVIEYRRELVKPGDRMLRKARAAADTRAVVLVGCRERECCQENISDHGRGIDRQEPARG